MQLGWIIGLITVVIATPGFAEDCINSRVGGGSIDFAEQLERSGFETSALEAMVTPASDNGATATQSETQRSAVSALLGLAAPLVGAVSESRSFVVVVDGRTGVHAVDLRRGADCRLVTLRAPLTAEAFNERARSHWRTRDYVMHGWDPPFTPSRALMMGLEMADDGSIRDTRPMRSTLEPQRRRAATDCVLHTMRNQRRVDVDVICADDRLVLTSLASEQLGQVWLSPTGEFVALQAPTEVRIVAVSGRSVHQAPLVGHNSTLAWLDQSRLLSLSRGGPRLHLTTGAVEPFEGCASAAPPALVIHEIDDSVTILDEGGVAWIWDEAAGAMVCP